jgi:peptidoglycan/LPS O-acetylase OafA/YrhL
MLFVQYLGDRFGPWLIFAMAMPIALVLAALSWHFVEEPFIRAKEKFTSPPPALLGKPQQCAMR